MIPRYKEYNCQNLGTKNKFNIWLTIEILICEALENLGEIPKKSLEIIKKKAKFDIDELIKLKKMLNMMLLLF